MAEPFRLGARPSRFGSTSAAVVLPVAGKRPGDLTASAELIARGAPELITLGITDLGLGCSSRWLMTPECPPARLERHCIVDDRLASILRFLQLTDEFKTIARQSWLTGDIRQETDAEHCWHMTLFALLLVDELDVEVDLAHVIAIIAVHDLVEIYAGDAYAFDYAGEEQDAKERAAAERLFGVLPSDIAAKVMAWWREFEEGETPEAQFARSLDRLQAFNQSILSGGRDWKEHGVTRSRTEQRMKPARLFDPVVTALVDGLYETADREGLWPETDPKTGA